MWGNLDFSIVNKVDNYAQEKKNTHKNRFIEGFYSFTGMTLQFHDFFHFLDSW